MGGINYSVHPLFFAVGLYYALTGRIFIFLVYSVTALIHETGHALVAEKSGYKLNKITLTPFGAIAKGNIEGLKFYDEFKIAAAGPAVNLATGLLFVAVWWIFPEAYAFTDIAAEANFAIALINLIPAYPLDGGRILSALLSVKLGERRAYIVCKIMGIAFGGVLIVGFVFTIFSEPNISLLIFGLFVLLGALSREKEFKYIRIFSQPTEESLMRGLPIKKQAVSKNITLKALARMTDVKALNEIEVYSGATLIRKLGQKELTEILKRGDIYSKLEKYV
ncbi:MAG: hypothetical protein J5911_03450 [Clostridia bacterium]|nr:hypothetical protein [Clostridia bacterium]